MQQDVDLTEEEIELIVPGGQKSIKEALKTVGNPRKALFKMRNLANLLAKQLGKEGGREGGREGGKEGVTD